MTRASHAHTLDLALRSIAKRRAALDAEEAARLREANAVQLWRSLGMVSMLDYMERILGYTPRAALERLRVAHALADLPQLTQSLADGDLSYSALRELTRVATTETETAWRDAAAAKNLREIEELVATHKRGDLPSDPADPDLKPRVIRFEVSPATYARLREAHAALDTEHGERLDDDRFVAALCGLALAGEQAAGTKAKFQVATVICESCKHAYQSGIAVGPGEVARAECDAQRIGSLDADVPARAHQDVSPKTRRFVWLRDSGRCTVAGCRSARNLEIHHKVPRSAGGSHDASNLVLLCDAHYVAHHAGKLDRLGAAVKKVEARSVLVNAGWQSAVASRAVEDAMTHVGLEATLEVLVREALKCCPR
jgi:hypothetical protein